ncbi:MAG: class I SAM-dependent RNA methyltransferase, partial [Acidobacteriota bacterium]
LHARCGPSGTINVGFDAPRSHQIVAIDRCPILTAGLERATLVARAIAEALEPANKPLDIHVTATDTGMDVDVRGSSRLNARLGSELARIAERHKLARLTRHGELIAQQGQPVVTIGRVQVPLPAGAFLQATAEGEETLARLARDYIGNAKMVADLFCGIGPFALRLAERARVTAIDIDGTAIAALKRGAAGAKGLKPIDASARDLFRRPLTSKELRDFDAVVFDPPRQGAEAQARELAGSAVRVAVAVSCDPVTFARDAKILIEGGYRLTAVTPVDQFRYSHHVEIVARFER